MSDTLHLTAPVDIQASADSQKPAKASILAYSGGIMRVPPFGPLVIDLAGLTVGSVRLLADHDSSLSGVAGEGQAVIRGGAVYVDGVLSRASEAAAKIIALHRDGVRFEASVGVEIIKSAHLPPGDKLVVNGQTITAPDSGLLLVRAGRLREVSIVPLGADASTSVAIAASHSKGTPNMADPITPTPTDRDRVTALWDQTTWHDTGSGEGPRQRAHQAMVQAASGAITYSDFERIVLTERHRDAELALLLAGRPAPPPVHASRRDIPSADAPAVLQAAFLSHLGREALAEKTLGADACQRARDLHITSMVDLCRAALQSEGRDLPASRDSLIRAAFSTHTLTTLLTTTGNKLLEQAYTAFPSVARIVARKLTANDFKTVTGYRLTGDVMLEQVGPAGEIQHGTLAQSAFTYKVDTYARMLGLTRQDVINDDLGAFQTIPEIIGRGAAAKLERVFWTLVLANTGSFFSGGNGNLISGGTSVLAAEGLRQAVQAMRQLVDSNGDPISVTPRFLVVPPELESTADALFASTNLIAGGAETSTAAIPSGNPFAGKYQPLVVPHLSSDSYSGYSATAWYLFGSPADVAAFGISYLSGMEAPTIEQADADFSTLGVQFRGYLDFGVCQVDKLGAVKSAGA